MKLKKTIQLVIIFINFVFSDSPINQKNESSSDKTGECQYVDVNTDYVSKKDITSFSTNILFIHNCVRPKFFFKVYKASLLNTKYQMLFNINSDIISQLVKLVDIEDYNEEWEEENQNTQESSFKNLYIFKNNFIIDDLNVNNNGLNNGNFIIYPNVRKNNTDCKNQTNFEYIFKNLDDDIIEKYKKILESKNINEQNKEIIEFSRYLINDKKVFENFDYDYNNYLLDYNKIYKELVEKYNKIIEIGLIDIKINELSNKCII